MPLTLWFVVSLIQLVRGPGGEIGANYQDFLTWLASPFNAAVMIVFLATAFHHAQLGMQVVFEDYVEGAAARMTAVVITKFLCYGAAAFGIVSTLIVCFGV